MSSLLQAIFSNTIVAFVILVGIVVFVHELGHFLMGRLLGIEVEEFSIGFGPEAAAFRRGNTKYRIGWLPLGGYVRFYGAELGLEIPLERRESSITTARIHKRMLVSAAGPLCNFVLSLCVMAALSAWGLPQAAPVVSVVPGGAAFSAGLRTGDVIKEIEGLAIATWNDLTAQVTVSAGLPLKLKVKRGERSLDFTVTPVAEEADGPFGERKTIGRIGVTQFLASTRVVAPVESLPRALGLRTGDLITAVDGIPVTYQHEVLHALEAHAAAGNATGVPLRLEVKRDPQVLDALSLVKGPGELSAERAKLEKTLSLEVPFERFRSAWKAHADALSTGALEALLPTTELLLSSYESYARGDARIPASDAWRACGVGEGVTLLGLGEADPLVNRAQVLQWVDKIQRARTAALPPRAPTGALVGAGLEVPVEIADAAGARARISCSVPLRVGLDPLNRPQVFLDVPFKFFSQGRPVPPVIVKSDGLVDSLRDGAVAVADQTTAIATALKRMISGEVPLANLGGPIAIAKVAGEAAEGGAALFLLTISWVSLNLGLVNLLPLPALDGGTLLLLGVESFYGKPLPLAVQLGVQRAGVFIILGLFVLVFYNDLLRLFHGP